MPSVAITRGPPAPALLLRQQTERDGSTARPKSFPGTQAV